MDSPKKTGSAGCSVSYKYWLILAGGTDICYGKCLSGTDMCTSCSISPFVGFNIHIWEVSLNFEIYRRFVWMDFEDRWTMNFEGSDTYAVSFYKEFDYKTERRN